MVSRPLIVLLLLTGCAVEHGTVYVKDGRQYGLKPGLTWRGRWWDYYQRGLSYAEGTFWEDAVADFRAAVRQRQADQRTARTYGFHFLDYFPHRELGIAYYHLGRYGDAIDELEASLRNVDSARAKFYLNKARQAQLRQTGRDTLPPRIRLHGLTDGLLTRQLAITVSGQAEDDTYVAAVAINNQGLFIELAEPRLPFTQEVALQEGSNAIDVVATDLLGRLTRERVTVHADRRGPLVSVERVDILGMGNVRRARLGGVITDQSRLRRLLLAGKQVRMPAAPEWEFDEEIPLTAGMDSIPFEVEDAAGNVTRGEIPLRPPTGGLPGIREGRPVIPALPRWAAFDPGTVVADLPGWSIAQRQSAPVIDREPPVLRLAGLGPEQTVYFDSIYLEGRVTDVNAITQLTLNGESLGRRKGPQLFFGVLVPLQIGENRLLLEALDEAGNTTRHEVVVSRRVQEVRQLGARLRVALLPAVKKGEAMEAADAVDEYLLTVFVQQGRFQLVERERLDALLREKLLSQTAVADQDTAMRIGKAVAAEAIVLPTVKETPQTFEVFARFVDVETGVVMTTADVYGEDLAVSGVRTLIAGLAWKFQQRLPMVEGLVIKRDGKRVMVDRGKKHALLEHMKTILFRDGEALIHPVTGKSLGHTTETLGEARIEAVADEFSQATLLPSEQPYEVKQLDRFITK